MNRDQLITALQLEPHPLEGGYFRRTYESNLRHGEGDDARSSLTSIYYMLTLESPIGFLHRNRSDIIHYFHSGQPITYITVSPAGLLTENILGMDIDKGQRPQLLVPGGFWKASALTTGEYGLISEAVSPGFDYRDNELATTDHLKELAPELINQLTGYIKH